MLPGMDNLKFGHWLQAQREQRGWSQSDLARLSGLHRQIINKTESGVSRPSVETYLALADALKISPIAMLRIAGLLPPGSDDQARFDDWQFVLSQLSPEDQEEMRQLALLKIERRKKEQSLKTLRSRTQKS
jgi:transcriptional regulator with XRE-family HTH domain